MADGGVPVWVDVVVVLVFIGIEALFNLAETSLVSLRESQVDALAEKGPRGRRTAELVRDPNRFLGSAQLGVTLTSLLSSAFGAVTLTDTVGVDLQDAGLGSTPAKVLAFVAVTLVITFITLIVGELTPKRIALQRAEAVALIFGPPLDRLARVLRPLIWLLSKGTDGAVRLFGGDPDLGKAKITESELRGLVASQNSLSSDERQIIDEVFAASTRYVSEVMVPRTEVTFLAGSMPVATAIRGLHATPHSRYPVTGESSDDVIGFVHVRDLFSSVGPEARGLVAGITREVARVPDTKPVLEALQEMRRAGQHLAVVQDEYGGTAGIITLEDLIEEVIGDIRDEYDDAEAASDARLLRNGDLEVDGLLNLGDFHDQVQHTLPEGPYETVAGLVQHALGHLPTVGESIEVTSGECQLRLTVATLDGRRVDRLRVRLLSPLPADEDQPA